MIEFVALRSKSYSHFTYDGDENKNVKDTKWCERKWKLKFAECKNCLGAT